jgi:ATP-dependent RNA helicase DHX8/PRP22
MEKLEHLSLVTKECTELQNHFGISDKTLVEFIISFHGSSDSTEDFQKTLLSRQEAHHFKNLLWPIYEL